MFIFPSHGNVLNIHFNQIQTPIAQLFLQTISSGDKSPLLRLHAFPNMIPLHPRKRQINRHHKKQVVEAQTQTREIP